MATNSEILDMLSTLEGIYGVKLEPEQFKGYYWALGDIDGLLLDMVGRQVVRVSKWFPKPSELRDLAQQQAERELDKYKTFVEEAKIKQQAYYLFDLLRSGEITEVEFYDDRAVQWAQKHLSLFVDTQKLSDLILTNGNGAYAGDTSGLPLQPGRAALVAGIGRSA